MNLDIGAGFFYGSSFGSVSVPSDASTEVDAGKVYVDESDTDLGFLNAKLIGIDSITTTIDEPGADEVLQVSLVNDEASPSAFQVYGTNAGAAKGWLQKGITVSDTSGTGSTANCVGITFDQSTGFDATNTSTYQAAVAMLPASATQTGVINTSTQTIVGRKTFSSGMFIGTTGLAFGDVTVSGGSITSSTGSGVGGANNQTTILSTKDDGTLINQVVLDVNGFTLTSGAYNIGAQTGQSTTFNGLTFTGGLLTSGSLSVSYSDVGGADEGAQDAVGTILVDSGTIDFTYSDATPSITAVVKAASITEAMQVIADNTTNNASTSAHGYLKKLDSSASHFMDGQGNWNAVPGTSLSGTSLASGIVSSSLTSLGTLNSLNITATAGDFLTIVLNDGGTNDTQTIQTITRNSTNTPATNFAMVENYRMESSTTADTLVFDETTKWTSATHASRKVQRKRRVYDTAARTTIIEETDGSSPMIGFLGAAATAAQASPDIGSDYVARGLALGTPTFACANLTGTFSAANLTGYAAQADMETGTSTTKPVNPAVMVYDSGVAKAACEFDGTGTPSVTVNVRNVASITDGGTGIWGVELTTAFSGSNYACSGASGLPMNACAPTDSNTISVVTRNSAGTLTDNATCSAVAWGDR